MNSNRKVMFPPNRLQKPENMFSCVRICTIWAELLVFRPCVNTVLVECVMVLQSWTSLTQGKYSFKHYCRPAGIRLHVAVRGRVRSYAPRFLFSLTPQYCVVGISSAYWFCFDKGSCYLSIRSLRYRLDIISYVFPNRYVRIWFLQK